MTARKAILAAFANLSLNKKNQEFNIPQIVKEAKVARSTFYYYFKSKDELFVENMGGLFKVFENTIIHGQNDENQKEWFEHLWENRALARRLLNGNSGKKFLDALKNNIYCAFVSNAKHEKANAKILASMISGAIYSILIDWLTGNTDCQINDIIYSINKLRNLT